MSYKQSYERCSIWRSVIVEINDVNRFMTDSGNYREATNAFLLTREQDWEERNPRPLEAKYIQEWIDKRLNDLYPEKYYEIDGKEVTEEQANRSGSYAWNVQIRILFDQELASHLEVELLEAKK